MCCDLMASRSAPLAIIGPEAETSWTGNSDVAVEATARINNSVRVFIRIVVPKQSPTSDRTNPAVSSQETGKVSN